MKFKKKIIIQCIRFLKCSQSLTPEEVNSTAIVERICDFGNDRTIRLYCSYDQLELENATSNFQSQLVYDCCEQNFCYHEASAVNIKDVCKLFIYNFVSAIKIHFYFFHSNKYSYFFNANFYNISQLYTWHHLN